MSALSWGELLKTAASLPKITRQEILAHPGGYREICGMVRENEMDGEAPYGSIYSTPIHMAPWMPAGEFLMADDKTVEMLQRVAEKFGPEVARSLVEKLLETQEEK